MGRGGQGWMVKDLGENRRGKRWQARAWCPTSESYKTKHFAADEEQQAKNWARTKAAGFRSGEDSNERVWTEAVATEYVSELEDRDRNPAHVKEVKRVIAEVVAAGGTDLRSPRFLGIVRAWLKARTARQPARGVKGGIEPETARELSPETINRYLLHLRSLCRFAIQCGYLRRSPLAPIRNYEEGEAAVPVFNLPELVKLTSPAMQADPYWLVACILIYTGCRIGEALHLRWECIDWSAKRVWVKRHPDYKLKRNKERSLPLQPDLAAILKPLQPVGVTEGWIVTDPNIRTRDTKKRWEQFQAYVEAAGVPLGRKLHATRHTWVSLILATGENVFSVKDWAGHEKLETTEGYAKAQEAFRDAVKDWPKGEIRLRGDAVRARARAAPAARRAAKPGTR